MNRKAQGEIITTVLIILLVIAAVVIVWQAVRPAVSSSTKQMESGLACTGIAIDLKSASQAAGVITLVVERGNDNVAGVDGLLVTVLNAAGTKVGTDDNLGSVAIPTQLGETRPALAVRTLTVGQMYTIKIAPKMGTNQCGWADAGTFTA
jgi:hypothetical protein